MRSKTTDDSSEVAENLPSTVISQRLKEDEVPLFWKLFGGSIFSIIFFLMIAIFGYIERSIHNTQNQLAALVTKADVEIFKTDVRASVEGLKGDIGTFKEKLSESVQSNQKSLGALETITTEFQVRAKEIEVKQESYQGLVEKLISLEGRISELVNENKELRDQLMLLREKLAKLEQ